MSRWRHDDLPRLPAGLCPDRPPEVLLGGVPGRRVPSSQGRREAGGRASECPATAPHHCLRVRQLWRQNLSAFSTARTVALSCDV